ncbi:hypothetical protein RchiOBHm_Chr5g0034321 [Rosa chinensis]|uniref:DUF1771 domain-containing protein n=2 Tax=Rosa chinensis TaxID=74649 RepID=A0A2P6QAZ2_ROSCH|nr:putative nuclear RNA export factor SDE5 isoform X1 [Rosa chinensis]PRQ31334.1 hypothetical protein RchiOBHm_Chr5g0034321 [Rosa chinensis]
MQASTLPDAGLDKEKKDLTYLLDVFSSSCSLEDIASAYVKARHNVKMAGEILCTSNLCSSDGASASKAIFEGASDTFSDGLSPQVQCTSVVPAALSSVSILQKTSNGVGNTRASKSKRPPLSVGTVSGVIGKDYSRQKTSTNESAEMQKPLKLELKEMPFSDLSSEEVQSSMTANNSKMHADIEEFLFEMLGDGFKLNMNVIKEVLSFCGYDREKSMEKLRFMSASTLENSDDLVSLESSKSTEKCSDQHSAHSNGSRNARNPIEGGSTDSALEKELFEALFGVPERLEEAPKVNLPSRGLKRNGCRGFHGNLVVEPFRDTIIGNKIATVVRREVTRAESEDVENSYEVLRNSVKEYWITMKEYYKTALEAFSDGDHVHADKFFEKGHFFCRKAREADDKSTEKLLQTRDDDDSVSLDLHDHEPKEAIRTLRLELTYLSGMPAFKYLRIIVGSNDEDTTRGARRRLIIKQLEKESIKWTEEENGQIILIRLDVIDPKRLSFSKKSNERIQSSPSFGL